MLSIIIPVFNGSAWLAEAIESVFRQIQSPIELIVIDDGSNDDSLKIAKSFEGGKGVKIISQVNKGLASARNTGIMVARGDWILPLDADDLLMDEAIERILWTIMENPNADIVAPSFQEFGLSNREVILMKDPKLEDFRIGNRIGYCQAIRRSVLLEVGGYSPKMVEGYEDLALTCLLLSKGKKIVTIPEVLWMYRVKKESMITKALQYHKKLLAQINKDVPEAKLDF